MKKVLFTFFIAVVAGMSASAQGYKVTLITPSYSSGIAYLTYHWGKNLNIQDSTAVSSDGKAVFKGEKNLVPGIYAIVFPGKNLTADFFVDKEQDITIKADTTKLEEMVVTGSKENVLFQQYQKFIAVKGSQMQKAKMDYNTAKTKQDSTMYEDLYNKYNKELNDYRDKITSEHPESMMAALLKAMKEPPYPTKKAVTHQDSLDNYYYYKSHYWDGITFMDERIIRTPFFLPKLERYYREVMPQDPDSIIKDLDYKLLLARSAPEMYKFLLNWSTDEYINPKYMGQDKIFVHLFDKYHNQGLTPWLNEKQNEAIKKRYYMVVMNLVGEPAANIDLVDSTGKTTSLYDVKADYTVVVFWDPTCGHCKQEVPKLDSAFKASWKAKNVKMYGVLTEDQKPAWVNYIKEHKMGDWINVYQTKEMEKADEAAQRASFRQLFDVTMTPTIFLLDKDKKIIGKKLNLEQLNDIINMKTAKGKS
ncbi:MAG: redoxin domain-containing protein [Bacteroidetes bacterium]|jgi:thiol-disulfide isomerase/thioredoxin|nr:redoxin domain-containing protein [Bacteroidota bacterium]